jgi:hypothetical protein
MEGLIANQASPDVWWAASVLKFSQVSGTIAYLTELTAKVCVRIRSFSLRITPHH